MRWVCCVSAQGVEKPFNALVTGLLEIGSVVPG